MYHYQRDLIGVQVVVCAPIKYMIITYKKLSISSDLNDWRVYYINAVDMLVLVESPSSRLKETLQNYLRLDGEDVELIVMYMNRSFKAAVKKAPGRSIIVGIFIGHWMRFTEKHRKNGTTMTEKGVKA